MPESLFDRPRYLTEHLKELRGCLVRSLLFAAAGVALALFRSDWIFAALLHPYRMALSHFPALSGQPRDLQTLAPVEVLMINMKLAGITGIAAAAPFILREGWVFAYPALKAKERAAVLLLFLLGTFFFAGGVLFGYYVIIPLALRWLIAYNLGFQFIPQWTLQGYFDFTMNFLLVFGCIFELPLVLAGLVGAGIATPAFLSQKRKHAVFLFFILAYFIAPSADPVTQTLVAVPLVVLYEIGILFSRVVFRKKAA